MSYYAGNLVFVTLRDFTGNFQQWIVEQYLGIAFIDVFKDSDIDQPKLIFESEKNHRFSAAGGRPMRTDYQPSGLYSAFLSTGYFLAGKDCFWQFRAEKLHDMMLC